MTIIEEIKRKIYSLETYISERYPLTLAIETFSMKEDAPHIEILVSFDLLTSVVEKKVRFEVNEFLYNDFEVLKDRLFT